jgi:putative transposase
MKLAPQEIRTYMITTVTAQRRRLFQVTECAELLIASLEENRSKGRLQLHAFVIMPDHIHLLITPAPEISLEKAIQFIKGGFSFKLKSKRDVWERSFDKRRIMDAAHFEEARRYIEANPVRAFMTKFPETFPLSSASRRDLRMHLRLG